MNKHHSYKINLCGLNDCSPEWHWETDGFGDYDLWAVFRGSGTLEVNGVHYKLVAADYVKFKPVKILDW